MINDQLLMINDKLKRGSSPGLGMTLDIRACGGLEATLAILFASFELVALILQLVGAAEHLVEVGVDELEILLLVV